MVVLCQDLCAVVIHIIAVKPVGDRRLRRDGLYSWMAVDAGHRSVKAGVRNAIYPHPAVVVRCVFYEPVNRIVSIGRFIDLGPGLIWNVWAHIFEVALAHITAAHILINKNIA